ncbi:MAG: NAD-dependent deacylase [Chitinophagales bacterium]|nr:NAD-dependent deacylase [Chitinophagales bacterium]MDW8418321.1 NAD-dependent deacylase [Chitinophagales bacterium]
MKKKIAVLTGAGISAESGIKTFRDSGGLWEEHRIEDVASPEGWRRNPQLVLDFYNQRRRQLLQVAPNRAHYALAELESKYSVTIITQNVDDLHERAGSTQVIHLHGELLKARSVLNEHCIVPCHSDIKLGDKAPDGAQLRPHIVWFGEAVPEIENAIPKVREADIFIIIGTSLVVYPAAGLVNYARYEARKWLIDPNDTPMPLVPNLRFIQQKATVGVDMLVKQLLADV